MRLLHGAKRGSTPGGFLKLLNIGVDIDGVLANFTDSYAALLSRRTGITFPPNSNEWPTVWYWDRAAMRDALIDPDEAKAIEKSLWAGITAPSSSFWLDLPPMRDTEAILDVLSDLRAAGHRVYFITTRPGHHAKRHTEAWLNYYGMDHSTVCIAANEASKGALAQGLGLDVFIDDKPENCQKVRDATQQVLSVMGGVLMEYPCRIFLVDAPYNRDFNEPGIERTFDVLSTLSIVVGEHGRNRVAA